MRTHGDWSGWLHYSLEGVTQTAHHAVSQAQQLFRLREHYRARMASKPRTLLLIDALFMNPYLTVARAEETLQVSNPTARRNMELLQQSGLLQETTGHSWGRLYLAKPILDILEDQEERHE